MAAMDCIRATPSVTGFFFFIPVPGKYLLFDLEC
jgi:hypothetical protein